ncbi:MAG: hypothetical protein JRI23_32995 [Deltaproteobacteria bacterium]|jgi:pyruvate,water dikinase|nr:hypothetical protein [Deltaproteobacteria bacterium]MBW2537071.1 hypothetical protein [Deltaproteobacteria bacterium]
MDSDGRVEEAGLELRSLQQMDLPGGGRASKAALRLGHKAVSLGRLLRDGVPAPRTWVLEGEVFTEFARAALPRGHDVRTLIKLAGSAEGHERCGRAHARLLAEPLPEGVSQALSDLWRRHGSELPWGLAVRASLVLPSGRAADEPPAPRAIVGLSGPEAAEAAIRRLWAASVLSSMVAEYAAAGQRDVAVALLIQETVDTTHRAVLVDGGRAPWSSGDEDRVESSWWLAEQSETAAPAPWSRLPPVMCPATGAGSGASAGEPADTAPSLGPRGSIDPDRLTALLTLADEARAKLDAVTELEFAFGSDADQGPWLRLLSIRPRLAGSHRRRQRRRGHFCELGLGIRGREPASHLGATIVERVVRGSVASTLADLRTSADLATFVGHTTQDRSYADVGLVARAMARVPLTSVDGLLLAVGGLARPDIDQLAREIEADHPGRWRAPIVGAASVLNQIRIDHDAEVAMRALDREARAIQELDLTLLPNDGITTTLASAQAALERSAALWTRWVSAQLALQLLVTALVRRRVPEAPPTLGMALTAGAGRLYAADMGVALAPTIEALASDGEAFERIRTGAIRSVRQLPDGRFRGALGHFLASYGDVARGAFDVARPRWSEDASDLLQVVRALSSSSAAAGSDDPTARARAAAASELARYEPFLPLWERRLLLATLDRCKALAKGRRDLDRRLLRSLRIVRRVLLDVDRRLRRIDPSIPEGGVFYCQPTRLMRTLSSGRPELGELIRMRQTDRDQLSARRMPPTISEWLPPAPNPIVVPTEPLEGIGVSPGVVEGRVRRLDRGLPLRLAGDEVLVLSHADVALCPLFLRAAAVVAETGGALSPAAEVAREYAIPAVFSAGHAIACLADGEQVRVDGSRGRIEWLAPSDHSSHRSPNP